MRARLWAILLAGLVAGCGDDITTGPASTGREPAAEKRQLPSLKAAVARTAARVEVPVVLPRNLPEGMELAGTGGGGKSAYIALRAPNGRVLNIQFGVTGFDGCGPTSPRPVRVGSVPAVLQSHQGDGRPATTLIWPATLKRLQGRYGLTGEYSAARMIAFAESMQRARQARPRRDRGGC